MKRKYFAFLEAEDETNIGISFPNFPGCVSVAKDLNEAIFEAKNVLEFHIEGMIEEKLDIPSPFSIKDIKEELEEFDVQPYVAIIEVNIPESKTRRINMSIPEYILQQSDNYLKKHSEIRSRSELFSTALHDYIATH
jgi:predicted RNase H-like HicB family nuclease